MAVRVAECAGRLNRSPINNVLALVINMQLMPSKITIIYIESDMGDGVEGERGREIETEREREREPERYARRASDSKCVGGQG